MNKKIVTLLNIGSLIFALLGGNAMGAQNATVEGHVTDAHTGDALPGANVFIVGTSLGASTDLNGKFLITNIPPGDYTIRTTYIGYRSDVIHVHLSAGAVLERNFKLEAVGVKGKEVVVTAQAAGQNAAINQQLSSNQIVNVVSAARIQELPDANAAESVGRLPGVSVLRSGGEAYAVVIR
ncbi:MAG: carboxypeptidase-like regulatory domain-containing protein, partial [Bacteroidetes bacterium]|nr:carboxypeptidase-like regulatory domain-containing protein [Bacteroidota bacterium]